MTASDRLRPAAGLSPPLSVGIVAAVLGIGALVGRRNAPDPAHRWHQRLDRSAA